MPAPRIFASLQGGDMFHSHNFKMANFTSLKAVEKAGFITVKICFM